ncbi:DNA repair protein rad14 [Fonsecaea pedrosoi]|nr:DNA repair protein rad14 [Fonsecaea pedrosoi]
MASRPSTPTPQAEAGPKSPLTPEQVRRLEINRLKAKALREQREAEAAATASLNRSDSPTSAGQKRSFATFAQTSVPPTSRDARNEIDNRPLEAIQPARNFAKYVDYDFSKMADTKGGFLTAEDDPYNKAMHADEKEQKPSHMTQKEWERQQLLKSLRNRQAGPFEPGISAIPDQTTRSCRECGTLEVDWKWVDVFHLAVCNACKEKFPEKYSLLTKTEAKEDYLLTDPELKDESLLPHLERPNPHKSTWHNMFLYLRCQVEEYAFSDKRWGSAEALDAEFEKRETEKKRRKENKFKSKLADLKKRTRVEAYQRSKKGGGGGNFGDDMSGGKHVHEFGRPIDNPETGFPVKTCMTCGLEVEELEL